MQCAYCKQDMPDDATVCPHCGQQRSDIQGQSFLAALFFMASLVLSLVAGFNHWWQENQGFLGYEFSWGLFLGSFSGWAFLALIGAFFYFLAKLLAAR